MGGDREGVGPALASGASGRDRRHRPRRGHRHDYIRREAALTERGVSERPIPVLPLPRPRGHLPLPPFGRPALDFLDEQTRRPDLRLDMDLQAGDIQFINNYTILHSRTGFVDGPEPDQKRHMLRLWLK